MWGWVSRLRKYFDNQKERDVDTYNIGVSGDTTKDLLDRFHIEAELRRSKTRSNIFIFEIGLNDAQYLLERKEKRISLSQFQDNLKAIYLSAQILSTTIVFLNIAPVDWSKTMPTFWNPKHAFYQEDILSYNKVLQNFCKDNNVLFVDVFELLNIDDLEDGVHPNAQWHEKIYIKVKDFMIEHVLI